MKESESASVYWKDLQDGCGAWHGLELLVKQRSPGWTVALADPGLIRISQADRPVLWARVHPYHQGVWWLLGQGPYQSPLEPIRPELWTLVQGRAGSEAWLRSWAGIFARLLATSPRSPLGPGCWHLEPARFHNGSRTLIERWDDYPTQQLGGFEPWESGALLGLQPPQSTSAFMVRLGRERVRHGMLPPVLVTFVRPLDMFLVLDGHDRLLASIEEGVAPTIFVLWHAQKAAYAPRLSHQLLETKLLQHTEQRAARALSMRALNQMAMAPWNHRALVRRPGPAPYGTAPRWQWEKEVEERLDALGHQVPKDIAEALLASDLPNRQVAPAVRRFLS